MSKIIMQKKETGLLPVYENDKKVYNKFKPDEFLSCEIRKARNPKQHRLFFAVLNCVLENSDNFKSLDEILIYAKYKLGLVDAQTIDGQLILIPKSIAFENMDNVEFEIILNKTLDLFTNFLQSDKEQLRKESENY